MEAAIQILMSELKISREEAEVMLRLPQFQFSIALLNYKKCFFAYYGITNHFDYVIGSRIQYLTRIRDTIKIGVPKDLYVFLQILWS